MGTIIELNCPIVLRDTEPSLQKLNRLPLVAELCIAVALHVAIEHGPRAIL